MTIPASEPLSDQELVELEEHRAKSTQGTWKIWANEVRSDIYGGDVRTTVPVCSVPGKPNGLGGTQVADAYYIGLMQRRIPRLLFEVQQSRARRAKARKRCVIGRYCTEHGFVHGSEAEELREKLEKLEQAVSATTARRIRRILDKVDARDSLAYLEARDRKKVPA